MLGLPKGTKEMLTLVSRGCGFIWKDERWTRIPVEADRDAARTPGKFWLRTRDFPPEQLWPRKAVTPTYVICPLKFFVCGWEGKRCG